MSLIAIAVLIGIVCLPIIRVIAVAYWYDESMDDRYGDGSDHPVCGECGLCIECGDCVCGEEQ